MVKLTGIFSQLDRKKVLVIGDLMLDTYTIGKAKRISPEAPVAVVHVSKEENRPGGAGNVILNLISLGMDVVAIGRVGNDFAGSNLKKSLTEEGVDIRGIFSQSDFCTPIKNRILADNQQVVRIDYETVLPISEQLENEIIGSLPSFFDGVSVLAISDYGKGFLSRRLLKEVIQHAKECHIPIITDPKGIDFTKYKGSTIIKPNLGEAIAAANLVPEAPLEDIAKRVLQFSDADVLMVTRSEAGLSLFHRTGEQQDFPVKKREIKDVTGAGDTVLAMLACALANKLSLTIAAQLSNVAAGIAIEHFGCARVTLSELARRLLEDDVNNKIFDAEHLYALKAALRNRRFAVLSVSSQQGFTSTIFQTIQELSQDIQRDLLIHVTDHDAEFISLLASLHSVKFILNSESLENLTSSLQPEVVKKIDSDGFLSKGIKLKKSKLKPVVS